ncbi:hypothetical protein SDC9_13901 [bioreactor metagenome]|uniref:KOW domain-containing protein n=1 Tax=bioreactor metagenome TaxID=1076179 RepID=A0A644TMJ5_9ZZZZ
MSLRKIEIGQLVKSVAGRDIGHIYVVAGFVEPKYVLLIDGRERSVAKPKKKNIRHVNVLNSIAKDVAETLKTGAQVTDEDIRRTITSLCTPDNM